MTAVEEPVTAKTDREELCEFIGWHIRHFRLGLNWTQHDLAALLEKDRPTLAGWEAGTRLPNAVDLVLVAEALGVTAGDLLPRSGFSPEEVLP